MFMSNGVNSCQHLEQVEHALPRDRGKTALLQSQKPGVTGY